MSGQETRTWQRLRDEVVRGGICTHCGTCVALSQGALRMAQTARGPLPQPTGESVRLPELAYEACPGKGIDYPSAYRRQFGALPQNWLMGNFRRIYVGHATDEVVRRQGASGGVITRTLIYLLEKGIIDGAVVLRQGQPKPWLAEPIIARCPDEVRAASQSVYIPASVNTILEEMSTFEGRLAYVGLPDQVAALRRLQQGGHLGANKVDYVLGPYVGTAIYLGAIQSFLRSNGVRELAQVAELKYREGEWPGYLQIRLHDGRVLRAKKFYYNYLIPFYITQASLQAVDFTNELTDISVGDAWHPDYEARGQGFSVVVARSEKAQRLLKRMQQENVLTLQETSVDEAMSMHGHMIDFKKRGSFLRNRWRQTAGKAAPTYGYRPTYIPLSRKLVELVIVSLFAVCGTAAARKVVEHLPLRIIGPLFDLLRRSWKGLSKPVKRKGLAHVPFELEADSDERNRRSDSYGADAGSHPALRPQTGSNPVKGFAERFNEEIGHWLRSSWSFADIEAHYDELAADYDAINDSAHSYFRRFTDAMRLADLPDDAYVLDVCARTGNGIAYFHEQGKVGRAVCADVSKEMGKLCEQRLREAGVENFRWVQIRDYDWPFADGEFDAVLSLETVEHFARPDRFIQELGRVVRPGGTLLLSTPNVLWEPVHALAAITTLHHSEGPHRFVPYRRLRQYVSQAGFQIEHAETTVLIPAGPEWLIQAGGWIEAQTRDTLMPLLGLRRLLICRKLP
ncbi:MAG TPA: coenzyme F420 hydrogenase/dehydrogenase beta subunit N-terminal domain-containing protein [Candidatus Sulfomarinibacteraceae bacterium]|nr:coenzyme F420 hydrogenase/dehydrogenase beta subunit N-terminal domain-containing protein [Candidatus Sulfomarinibacteraceae bacterium]